MKCAEASRLLNPYIDGELELQSALEIEAHLQECPKCRAALAGMQALRVSIAHACEPEPAPARLRKAVQARLTAGSTLQQEKPRPAWPAFAAWLAAAPGIAALLLLGWLVLTQPWNARPDPGTAHGTRVVYHVATGDNVGASLRTLKNHLDATPDLRVVVVAHNDGIKFLLRDAMDAEGQPFFEVLRELRERGVEFRVCANTLTRQKIDTRAVVPEAVLVPSGIAEISRLQGREGYTYLRL
jgi:anti-sigma factor (TIGR02949 family)